MNTTLIPPPKCVPPDQWQIPIAPGGDRLDWFGNEDYHAYEQYLETQGFKKIHEVNSIRHGETGIISDMPSNLEVYAIWHHPEGIIATSESYTIDAYTGDNGNDHPSKKVLRKLSVNARIDTGTGLERQFLACEGIKGKGSTFNQMDGGQIRNINESVDARSTLLSDVLRRIQSYGKFIPIEKWGNYEGDYKVYIPDEILYPLSEKQKDHPFKSSSDVMKDTLLSVLLKKLPIEFANAIKKPTRGRRGEWIQVEDALTLFTETLYLDGKDFRGSYDEELLIHWSEVACGLHGENIENWRAYEIGPGNLSLPIALIQSRKETNSEDRIKCLLKNAPEDVLLRWATTPDAAGYTLGLHIALRVFVENSMIIKRTSNNLVSDIMGILISRIGANNIIMATEKRSLMGLPLQFDDSQPGGGASQAKNNSTSHEDFKDLILLLESHDVSWDQHIRWRNYPNIGFQGEPPMSFFSIDGAAEPDIWKNKLGTRHTGALDGVFALLKRKRLNNVMNETNKQPCSNVAGLRLKM